MNEFEIWFSLCHKQERPNIYYCHKSMLNEMFIEYVENIMNGFLHKKAQCKCLIKPLEKGHNGSAGFDDKINTFIITISEEVVKSICDGTNPFNIFMIFHEIAHVYDRFKIKNKNFKDANLKKVCIEQEIRKTIPNGNSFYDSNYETMAIEAHANLVGAQLTRDFYKKCSIELNENEKKKILLIEFFALKELNNLNRDICNLFDGSQYNVYELSLSKILSEIEHKNPNIYNNLEKAIGKKNLTFEEEKELTEFETKLYSDSAILELSDIINSPLFTDLVEEKTQHRPRI